MPKVTIEKLDHFGRGIAHINNEVIFIPNALPGETVEILINKTKKHYEEAVVTKYYTKSNNRAIPPCSYFPTCNGCHLQFLTYAETLAFKQKKIEELAHKNHLTIPNLTLIKNPSPLHYRNKISLKLHNNEIGYYLASSHKLLPINTCKIAQESLNEVLKTIRALNIKEGSITIRTNQNNEILLVINSLSSSYNIDLEALKSSLKLVGIVYNDHLIYGVDYLFERIGGFLFKISYDSFFQVNPFITKHLFDVLAKHIKKDSQVLDLYCGVGTLSLVASQKAKSVLGIEIIPNAIINACTNASLNHRPNTNFVLGDVATSLTKISTNFDTIIVDPPRKGLDSKTLSFILKTNPESIIYISCDANTLMRDLKVLTSNYLITNYYILDMFSYTYHVESMVVLKRK